MLINLKFNSWFWPHGLLWEYYKNKLELFWISLRKCRGKWLRACLNMDPIKAGNTYGISLFLISCVHEVQTYNQETCLSANTWGTEHGRRRWLLVDARVCACVCMLICLWVCVCVLVHLLSIARVSVMMQSTRLLLCLHENVFVCRGIFLKAS